MSDYADQHNGFPVFCPQPRRLTQLNPTTVSRSVHMRDQIDLCDSAGVDLLDIILTNDTYGDMDEQWDESDFDSSFFCGSPPTRASNPLIHDARFLEEKSSNTPLTPLPFMSSNPPATGATRGEFFRSTAGFGPSPVAVRIEGFNNRSCSSIPAFA